MPYSFAVTRKPRKNPHAVALGKRGGKKGGIVRAAKLTAEERSDIARMGGRARQANARAKKPKKKR